jgi:hypothetical protein
MQRARKGMAADDPRPELLVNPNDSLHVAATAPDEVAQATLAFIGRHEQGARA